MNDGEDFIFGLWLREAIEDNCIQYASCEHCNTIIYVPHIRNSKGKGLSVDGVPCPNCGIKKLNFMHLYGSDCWPETEFKPEICKDSEEIEVKNQPIKIEIIEV